MLKPKTLISVLSKANTGGVECTILFNKEGSLLAYSGYGDKDARMKAAICSSIWLSYEKQGKNAFNDDSIKHFIIQCENGYVMVKKVSSVLLCMHANKTVPIGILKSKVETLANFLESPLNCVLPC